MSRVHGPLPASLSCLVAAALIVPAAWSPVAHAGAPIRAIAAVEPPAATTPPATAPAAEPAAATAAPALGPDEVELVDGGFVRGTVVELVPKTRVVIVPDGTNERREIPWEQIADVKRGVHAAPAEQPWPKEEPAPAPKGDEAGLGKPRIHLELTRPRVVKLYEIDSEIVASGYYSSVYGMQFRSRCVAPCDRVIDGTRGQDFFLSTGESGVMNSSRRFSLTDKTGDVTIRVKPGNTGLRMVGAVLLGLGIGCLLGGAVLTALPSTRKTGYVFLGIGAPSLVAGIPMLILGRTRYELADTDDAEPR